MNGRDEAMLKKAAGEVADTTGATIIPVAADVSTPEGQKAILAACPDPDILVNNNAGPPLRNYKDLDRAAMIAG